MLNLPLLKGDSKARQHQDSQLISVSMDRKEVEHCKEHQEMIKTKVGMPGCTGRF